MTFKKCSKLDREVVSSHADGDFFWNIQEGRGEMPAFNEDLTEMEIWSIISFIRSSTP